MMRFFGFLACGALVVGVWGYVAGWFSFATSEHDGTRSFTLDVHTEEFSQDLDVYEGKVHAFVQMVDRKIAELRDRHREASAKARPEIEKQIEAEQLKKDEAEDALRDLQEAPPDQAPARKKKLEEVLDEAPPPEAPAKPDRPRGGGE